MSLYALALNPNLTAEEFADLAEKHTDGVVRLWKTAEECTLKLPPDQQMRYLSAILPTLLMLSF